MTRPTTTGKAQDLITFTRSTTGTALAKISYGEELVTNGDFSSDSDWNKGSSTTIVNGEAVFNGALSYVYQNAVTVGKLYFCSVTVNTWNSGAALSVGSSATGSGTVYSSIERVSNTTTEFYFTAQTTTLGIGSRSFNVDGSIDNISVKEVLYDQPDGTLQLFNHPINKPRIEYDASGNCLGLLVEEARTNLLPYSEDFSNVQWLTTNASFTSNAPISPDGTLASKKFVASSSVSTSFFNDDVTLISGQTYTQSIMVKAGEISWFQIAPSTGFNSGHQNYNLANGTLGANSNIPSGAAAITDLGNGWYRCSLTLPATANYGRMLLAWVGGNNNRLDSDGTVTPDGIKGVYIFGAQLEQGTFPTSYIPTSGSAVTRSADVATLAVSEFGYNQDQGTVVVEAQRFGTNNYPRTVMIDNGSESESISLGAWGQSTTVVGYVVSSGAVQASVSTGGALANNFKHSLAYKKDDFGSSRDGGAVVTDTSGVIPATPTTLRLGRNSQVAQFLNGHIKSVQYYPLRLSNAQLQALTV